MLMTINLEGIKDTIMAQKVDPKEIVTIEELAHSNNFQIETILRYSSRKVS